MNIKQFVGVDSFGKRPDGTEISHEEKFTAVVNAIGLNKLIPFMPESKEHIQKALQSDEHLNNIPLRKWDSPYKVVRDLYGNIGITTASLSDTVCTLKRAAIMWAAE